MIKLHLDILIKDVIQIYASCEIIEHAVHVSRPMQFTRKNHEEIGNYFSSYYCYHMTNQRGNVPNFCIT